MRAKAIEAYRFLNDYVGDLVAGTRSLELFEDSPLFASVSSSMKLVLRRMVLSHLVVTLSKWGELYDRYLAIIPGDVRTAWQDLRKELDRRGIRKFRNTVVGHIWDNELHRALTVSEVESRLASVIGDGLLSFRTWINDPAGNQFPRTVVAICERVRDRIGEDNGLGPSDLKA